MFKTPTQPVQNSESFEHPCSKLKRVSNSPDKILIPHGNCSPIYQQTTCGSEGLICGIFWDKIGFMILSITNHLKVLNSFDSPYYYDDSSIPPQRENHLK